MPALVKVTDKNILGIQIEVYQTKSTITVGSQGDALLDIQPGSILIHGPVLSIPEPESTPRWEIHRDACPRKAIEDSEQLAVMNLDLCLREFSYQ